MNPSESFITERLQLAVFLHAANRLTLSRLDISPSHKVRFVFGEPANVGEQAELDFDRGATVSAVALFASQKFLRRKMKEVITNNRSIEYGR